MDCAPIKVWRHKDNIGADVSPGLLNERVTQKAKEKDIPVVLCLLSHKMPILSFIKQSKSISVRISDIIMVLS